MAVANVRRRRSARVETHCSMRLAGVMAVASLLMGCGGNGSTSSTTAAADQDAPQPSVGADPTALASDAGSSVALTPPPLHPSVDGWSAGMVLVDPEDGSGERNVAVRIAATSDQRSHGLMEVADLPDGSGMWFAYDTDTDGGYWMKGTLVDLDIAWVDAGGTIVAVASMQVCEADPCPSWEPGADYRSALEVPAGWLAANGVEVGDTAKLVTAAP